MKKFFKKLVALGASIALTLPTIGVSAQEKKFEGEVVKVGVVGDQGERVWREVAKRAKEEEGIEIELTLMTDYQTPNEALRDGSLDLNSFQHILFLENWNEANDCDLQVLGNTTVTPLGLYSEKIDSIDEIEEGAIIAVPNDPTNYGRAMLLLELAGLIKVDPEAGLFPEAKDIIENPLNIKIEELEANMTAQALPDVTASVINIGHAIDAGFTIEDAIFNDASDYTKINEKYINVIACRAEDTDNELYKKVVELYQTDENAKFIYETSKKSLIPAFPNSVIGTKDTAEAKDEDKGEEKEDDKEEKEEKKDE